MKKKSEKVAHYESILLEDIRSKLELVIEVAQETKQQLELKIDHVKTELTQEILDVKTGLSLVSRKVNHLETRFDSLETKVDKMNIDLSEKIDRIGLRLDQHDVEIENLKKVQGLTTH